SRPALPHNHWTRPWAPHGWHRRRPSTEQADMQIWAIANQKGGVGKTTTSLLLARGLAGMDQRVLLVDLDPHASLTRAFGVPTDPAPPGTHDIFSELGGADLTS